MDCSPDLRSLRTVVIDLDLVQSLVYAKKNQ